LPEAAGAGRWFALALLVILLDQLSKFAASHYLEYARPLTLTAWFDLTLHHNRGAAFSFLSAAGGWQRWLFAGLAVAVSAMLVVWLRSLHRGQWLLALGLSLVLGGALGNLIDRLWLGYVVDFISVHYRDHYFPTFNIADSAISCGAALVVLDSLLAGPREADGKPGTDADGGAGSAAQNSNRHGDPS
jgi:signal peptidase II